MFDGLSYLQNESFINEFLEPGLCLLPLRYDVLQRFRFGSIGIIAGIKETLLQISVDPNHHDHLRFLWVNFDKDDPDFYIYWSTRFDVQSLSFKWGFEALFSVKLDLKYI